LSSHGNSSTLSLTCFDTRRKDVASRVPHRAVKNCETVAHEKQPGLGVTMHSRSRACQQCSNTVLSLVSLDRNLRLVSTFLRFDMAKWRARKSLLLISPTKT
jgi:hypothetical protein